MSVERAHLAVEDLIADHVAASFRQAEAAKAGGTAAQIRSRITDRLQNVQISEQDNAPRALTVPHSSLSEAFTIAQSVTSYQDRAERLALLQKRLEGLSRSRMTAPTSMDLGALHVDRLAERQQLVLKNEFAEGFGRVETWLISMAALALVLLKAIDFSWALPILALGIGRALYLDRQCQKRRARIAQIDALAGPAA